MRNICILTLWNCTKPVHFSRSNDRKMWVRKPRSTSLAESSSLNNVISTVFLPTWLWFWLCFWFASNQTRFICVAAKWLQVSWKPYGLPMSETWRVPNRPVWVTWPAPGNHWSQGDAALWLVRPDLDRKRRGTGQQTTWPGLPNL